jgi:hypothetical protein
MKALLGLISEQMAVLEENLDQLYDDQFIETCAEWVVPYIGELVATRGWLFFLMRLSAIVHRLPTPLLIAGEKELPRYWNNWRKM